MILGKVLTSVAAAASLVAASLVAAPVAAQAAPAELRTGADIEGENLRGGFIIPLIALIAIILGLCVGTSMCGGDDDSDLPHSP
jgi:hypothetical protein